MPQMCPLNWLYHYYYFISLFLCSILLNHFNYKINTKKFLNKKTKDIKIINNNKIKNFKWKW
nr:ATP synthase F0 subunit 8 [Palaeocimbex sp. CSCS-Hym-MC0161]